MFGKKKITKIEFYKDFNGKPNIDKRGKPYTRVLALFDGDPLRYSKLSYNESDSVRKWKDGDEVWVTLETVGQFHNFKEPTRDDVIALVFSLIGRVERLEGGKPAIPHLDEASFPDAE